MPQLISWTERESNFSTVSLLRMDFIARTTSSSLMVFASLASPLLRLARCFAAQEPSDTSSFLAGVTLRQHFSSVAVGVAGERSSGRRDGGVPPPGAKRNRGGSAVSEVLEAAASAAYAATAASGVPGSGAAATGSLTSKLSEGAVWRHCIMACKLSGFASSGSAGATGVGTETGEGDREAAEDGEGVDAESSPELAEPSQVLSVPLEMAD